MCMFYYKYAMKMCFGNSISKSSLESVGWVVMHENRNQNISHTQKRPGTDRAVDFICCRCLDRDRYLMLKRYCVTKSNNSDQVMGLTVIPASYFDYTKRVELINGITMWFRCLS